MGAVVLAENPGAGLAASSARHRYLEERRLPYIIGDELLRRRLPQYPVEDVRGSHGNTGDVRFGKCDGAVTRDSPTTRQ